MSSSFESQGPTLLPQLLWPGQSPHVTVFWDTSMGPATNDPIQKLGNFGSRLGAIAGLFDEKTQSFTLLDGYHKGEDVTSLWPLAPDNWTPRLHDELGHGKDNTWDLRLSVDHTNPDSSRATRNTFLIDQETQQQWGELGDIFRIIEKGSDVDDKELHYTDAGFLEIFSAAQDPKGGSLQLPTIVGNSKRGAVALDISRNLGYVCDTGDYAQLAHIMVLLTPPKSDVATPSGGGDPDRPDVETPATNSNRPPVASVDPNDPSWTPPNNRRPGEIGGSGNNFQVVGGVVNVDGSPIASQPQPTSTPAADNSNPTRPKTENELGLRLDTGWLVDKLGKVARFTDEQPPSAADQGDGDIKLCTIFVLDNDAEPDDKLDTRTDDNSNHEQLPKPVKKKKFAAWVKVPKPGNSECHHYDYSYHHPPPGSSSSSSGGSSGSSVATPGGGSGTGSPTPEGPDESPDPKPGVPTVDRAYQNPDGSPIPDDAPSDWNSQPSMQTQAGWAPPRSPGYGMRGNILPSDFADGWNPVGSVMATKASRYPNVTVQLVFALAEPLAAGEVIELNVIIGQHAGGEGPTDFYRQAFVIRDGTGYSIDPAEYEVRFYFAGFDPDESMFTVLTERRNDTTHGTNSDAEVAILRTTILSDGL